MCTNLQKLDQLEHIKDSYRARVMFTLHETTSHHIGITRRYMLHNKHIKREQINGAQKRLSCTNVGNDKRSLTRK